MNEKLAFKLELRPVPGKWFGEPEYRLRGLLKLALRSFGLRATACTVVMPPPATEPPLAALKRSL